MAFCQCDERPYCHFPGCDQPAHWSMIRDGSRAVFYCAGCRQRIGDYCRNGGGAWIGADLGKDWQEWKELDARMDHRKRFREEWERRRYSPEQRMQLARMRDART